MNKEENAVNIGTYFEQFVSSQVSTGRFASNAEVLQAGLRLLEEQELRLRLQKSELDQKPTEAATDEISSSVTDAMRALASTATDSASSIPAIPATKGLLRSHIAAE